MLTKLLHKIVRSIFYFFMVFPIKRNRIIFNSQKGRMFACNPRSLFEALYLSHSDSIEFVWCLNRPSEDLTAFKGIKTVKYNSLAYFYYQMTSKVIVANIPSPIYIPLRRGQVMFDTWHGGGAYKKIGLLSPKQASLSTKNVGLRLKTMENVNNQKWEQYKAKFNAKDTSFFVSSCRRFTEVMLKSQYLPRSAYLEIGMPRNDIFFQNGEKIAQKARMKLGISAEAKVVLFAPTYRGNVKNQDFNLELDIDYCVEKLKERWGGDWVFVFRGHVLGSYNNILHDNVVNGSGYEEMQELLVLADVFITDYSSSMWDFALTKKPAFLFTPDLEYYLSKDRGFYTPIDEWAFPYARTNIELGRLIVGFDYEAHLKKVESHLFNLGSFEQGTATKALSDKLLSFVL